MNPDLLLVLGFGMLIGGAMGWWRCLTYCRKLRHFGIDLDEWAHYDPHTRQARRPGDGEAAPASGSLSGRTVTAP